MIDGIRRPVLSEALRQRVVWSLLSLLAIPFVAAFAYWVFLIVLMVPHVQGQWITYAHQSPGTSVRVIQGKHTGLLSCQFPASRLSTRSGYVLRAGVYERQLALNPFTCLERVERGYLP